MLYVDLIFHTIEFVSTIVFFALFIHEEICQSGVMTCYEAVNYTKPADIGPIKQLTYLHGIQPGKTILEEYGIFSPWNRDGFRLFFQATEQQLREFEFAAYQI